MIDFNLTLTAGHLEAGNKRKYLIAGHLGFLKFLRKYKFWQETQDAKQNQAIF